MITEDQLEQLAIQWFQDTGWNYVHGAVIAPEGVSAERAERGNIEHRTSNIEHRTSNAKHRTSKGREEGLRGFGAHPGLATNLATDLATKCRVRSG